MILDEICEHKRTEVSRRKAALPLEEVKEQAEQVRVARPFREALRRPGIALIAEVKFASPTKGVLIKEGDPVDLAGVYEQAGAHAISVLTDERYFQGSMEHLTAIHQNAAIPCLCKDFTVDEYQIYEARAAQADAVLLIVKVLSDQQLRDYLDLTALLGMDALVETHTAEEIDRALKADAHIIGINNRDLSTFQVNLGVTLDLKKRVPGGKTLVSESGVRSREHVRLLEDGGVDAILVGEALITSGDIVGKIRELLGRDAS